jgi:hypothetical protein
VQSNVRSLGLLKGNGSKLTSCCYCSFFAASRTAAPSTLRAATAAALSTCS